MSQLNIKQEMNRSFCDNYLHQNLFLKEWKGGLRDSNESIFSFFSVSQVYLVPQNLARKRVWNKKYPICIELAKQDDFMSKAEGVGGNQATSSRDNGAQEQQSPSSARRCLTLYLFGRTGRDKEEWFQRFLSASNARVQLKKSSCAGSSRKGKKVFNTITLFGLSFYRTVLLNKKDARL